MTTQKECSRWPACIVSRLSLPAYPYPLTFLVPWLEGYPYRLLPKRMKQENAGGQNHKYDTDGPFISQAFTLFRTSVHASILSGTT